MRFHLTLIAVGLAVLAAAALSPAADARTQAVSTGASFNAVARDMRSTGGVIVLRRGHYGALTVGARSARWLTIRARPGVTVRYLSLRHTQRVRVQGVRVRGGVLNVHSSSRIRLDRIRVLHARVSLAASSRVTIRGAEFARCGENREACLGTGWGSWGRSSHVKVIGSRFHDCYGCDFIRGQIGTGFTLRGSRLDRAVPGPCGTTWECNHQDGVQISRARNVLIEGNRFGLVYQGAAQIYVSGDVVGLTIRNNVFLGTDPAFPDWVGVAAITLGNHKVETSVAVPLRATIVNNTILTGTARANGWASSVYLSPGYLNFPVEDRPVVANNVIGLLGMPERLCALASVSSRNIVREGFACSEADAVLDPMLDDRGEPLDGSPVVDQADPAHATLRDLRGLVRDDLPDIGAFEFLRR